MWISCVLCFGDIKLDLYGIIFYCLDKLIILFGEKLLFEYFVGWLCSYREDFFMFGKCFEDCLFINYKFLEFGCSIGILLCVCLGFVGFLYEFINLNNEFGFGFFIVLYVVIKDFKELYNDEILLFNYFFWIKKYLIVYLIC